MSINEFDKLFKERFEEQEFAFDPKNWDRLTRELPKEQRKRQIVPWLTGIAASVALLAGVSWFLHNGTIQEHKTNPTASTKTELPGTNRVASATQQRVDENPLQNVVPVSGNMLISRSQTAPQPLETPITNSVIEQKPVNSPITKPYDKNLLPFTPDPVAKPNEQIVTKSDPVPTPTKSITDENLNNPIFFTHDPEARPKDERRISVSLAGGVNYGSFNTGYGASVNARQKLSKKLFVEGDLGFMQNQEMIASAMSTEQFDVMSSGQFRGRPARIEEKPYNIYYLQMSPSIGYQLHKNIAIGLGADVQKLLDGKNEDRPVVATEQGFKLIPLWDAGVTGKTEYTISKRLKAGVLYREGVNNLLQGNNNYYERRYLQIQMKLRLFGK